MQPIPRLSGAAATAPTVPRRAADGFRLPDPGPPPPPLAGPLALGGLLALQETDAESVPDRAARRRGRDLLAGLAALQRDLLAGAAPRLGQLAALLADLPDAADPAVRAALAAAVVRARVELARRRTG